MVAREDSTQLLRRLLEVEGGFDASLIEADYRFAKGLRASLAAFAHRPFDARSICIGAVTSTLSNGRQRDVKDYRDLGAPVLLWEHEAKFEIWRIGPALDQRLRGDLSSDGLASFFRQHPEILRPRSIYEAKTSARVQPFAQTELFVDPGLLPYVESQMGARITATIVESIAELAESFRQPLSVQQQDWVFTAVFRLLAGKVLHDKEVPGFVSSVVSRSEEMIRRVERHYGSKEPLAVAGKRRLKALDQFAARLQNLGDLRNLTTESLGDVYEQALITKEARKRHGTHKTPAYLVDYVVWQLGSWIAEIPPRQIRVFEPGCGHAPFLVAAMRLLRSLDLDVPDFSQFVRDRFTGIDNDKFALEIARLSLTVADEPNPDGWTGLQPGNMYKGNWLEQTAAQTTVLLTNPPYESRLAEELLARTIPQLPVGAVFGAVIPATLLFSDKPRMTELRKWMTRHCQISEVGLFPDGLFTFGDHECAVLIGRRLPEEAPVSAMQSRIRRVRDRDEDRECFRHDYRFSSTRLIGQSRFQEEPSCALWVAEYYDEIWSWLRDHPRLETFARINQGLQHKGSGLPKGSYTIEDTPFPHSVKGFATSAGEWHIHEHPELKHFNLDPDVLSRRRAGADCVPQVLVNYNPVSRGKWRLMPFVDEIGRPFSSNFLSIRPVSSEWTLSYLWSLAVSPIANFFAHTHLLKRHILKGVIDRLPVPNAPNLDVRRISRLALRYLDLARRGKRDMFNKNGYSEAALRRSLLELDSEVLRLYDLPASAERLLLDQFRGEQRPGVPIPFTEFMPEEVGDVPLYVYLSRSFQRALRGESADLSNKEIERYEMLTAKQETERVTEREINELHALQAEVDGRDYSAVWRRRQKPLLDTAWKEQADLELRRLGDRAASASLKRQGFK